MTASDATSDATHAARVAVVGSGPLAGEVVRNLALAGVQATLHRPDDFWHTLRLSELQDCVCAIAAGGNGESRRRLNQLCRVAGVDFVNVSLADGGITIDTFPFGSAAGSACLQCAADRADADAAQSQAPDSFEASVAGALAVAAATRQVGMAPGARWLHLDSLAAAGAMLGLERRHDCPLCAALPDRLQVIRTRNRWTTRQAIDLAGPELEQQPVRLSDAVVTACACAACGTTAAPMAAAGRAGTGSGPAPLACPRCGSAAVRVETRDSFSLGELMARFGTHPVPAKFALVRIGAATVCFDLQDAAPGDG